MSDTSQMGIQPIEGSPAGVLVLAEAFEGSADDLRAILTSIRALSTGSVWDGAAGAAFGAALGELGPVLQRLLDRYAGAAGALRTHAPELERAQRLAQHAVTMGDDATEQVALTERQIETAMAGGETWESPRVQAVLTMQRFHADRQRQAIEDYAQARDIVDASDQRCAATLRECAADPISDPALYRILHRVSATGSALGQLEPLTLAAPELKPITAIGATAGSLADGALFVGYGEGDWGEVAVGLGLSTVGSAGGALKKGAKLGAVKGLNGEYRVAERMTMRNRLKVGIREEVVDTIDGLHGLKSVPTGEVGRTAVLGFAPKVPLRDKVRTAVVGQVNKRVLDDLRLIRANGTTRMFVAGVTLEGAEKAATLSVEKGKETKEPPK